MIHHGLLVGADGKKLSKRAEGTTIASLRDAGYPAEAVRAYLEELGLPRHDVHLDLDRIRSLSVDVLGQLDDEALAERVGVPVEAAPLLRGAHDLVEARALAPRRPRPAGRPAGHSVRRRWSGSSSCGRSCRTCSTRTRRRRSSAS